MTMKYRVVTVVHIAKIVVVPLIYRGLVMRRTGFLGSIGMVMHLRF